MALFGGRDEKERTEPPAARPPERAAAPPPPARATPPASETRFQTPPPEVEKMANVGKSITIKGDISGDEDLLVEGKVEGKVDLPEHQLTVGANGICEATVNAKTVIVTGRVAGDVTGIERVEIQATGVVDGDVKAPRLVVEEGAVLNGSISMTKKEGAAASASKAQTSQPSPPSPKAPAATGGFANP
jgi:cytoskeletal protein CcmA (bactofilin family)